MVRFTSSDELQVCWPLASSSVDHGFPSRGYLILKLLLHHLQYHVLGTMGRRGAGRYSHQEFSRGPKAAFPPLMQSDFHCGTVEELVHDHRLIVDIRRTCLRLLGRFEVHSCDLRDAFHLDAIRRLLPAVDFKIISPPPGKGVTTPWPHACPLSGFNFHGLTRISFMATYNSPLTPRNGASFPSTVTHVVFGRDYCHPLDRLHVGLTHLTLENGNLEYFHPLDHLPTTLQHLVIRRLFNRPLDHLPDGLTHLILRRGFQRPLDHLPSQLEELDVGDSFNLPLDHLPTALRRLATGDDFRQPVDFLPPGLLTLSLGMNFIDPLDHLPPALLHLSLGYSFNRPLDHLPSQLQSLSLGDSFNQPLDHLPNTLVSLRLGVAFSQILHHLPPSLARLRCASYPPDVDHLPPSLTHLRLPDEPFPVDTSHYLHHLPAVVTHLKSWSTDSLPPLPFRVLVQFNFATNHDLFSSTMNPLGLPQRTDSYPSCRVLELSSVTFNLDLPLASMFPNLVVLVLGASFNSSLGPRLPDTLRYLHFGRAYNQPFEYPDCQLTHLRFGVDFAQRIDSWPSQLIYLSLTLHPGPSLSGLAQLPSTLTHLSISSSFPHFTQPLPPLPAGLLHFSLHAPFYEHPLVFSPSSRLTYLHLHLKRCPRAGLDLPPSLTYLSLTIVFPDECPLFSLPAGLKELRIASSLCLNLLSSHSLCASGALSSLIELHLIDDQISVSDIFPLLPSRLRSIFVVNRRIFRESANPPLDVYVKSS